MNMNMDVYIDVWMIDELHLCRIYRS